MPLRGSNLLTFFKVALEKESYINCFWILRQKKKFALDTINKHNRSHSEKYDQIFMDWFKLKVRKGGDVKSLLFAALKRSAFIKLCSTEKIDANGISKTRRIYQFANDNDSTVQRSLEINDMERLFNLEEFGNTYAANSPTVDAQGDFEAICSSIAADAAHIEKAEVKIDPMIGCFTSQESYEDKENMANNNSLYDVFHKEEEKIVPDEQPGINDELLSQYIDFAGINNEFMFDEGVFDDFEPSSCRPDSEHLLNAMISKADDNVTDTITTSINLEELPVNCNTIDGCDFQPSTVSTSVPMENYMSTENPCIPSSPSDANIVQSGLISDVNIMNGVDNTISSGVAAHQNVVYANFGTIIEVGNEKYLIAQLSQSQQFVLH